MPQTRAASLKRIQANEIDRLLGADSVPKPVQVGMSPDAIEVKSGQAVTSSETISSDPAARSVQLDALRARHDVECPLCTTWTGYTQTVFGVGNPCADLMFIGEAPGEQEDLCGEPFVGRAGKKLNEIITAMGLTREEVYIANVLKSRPPENRTPQQHEIDACGPFLIEQIRIIRPRVIVTLGGPATKILLNTSIGITRLRGQWAEFAPPFADGESQIAVPVMPTFHPAYLLRNYTPDTRQKVWSDMKQVMERLGIASAK